MTKFEIGKTYFMRSACDHNCIWTYKVVRRTDKSVWLDSGREVKRCVIKNYGESEFVYPLGRFSMAPCLDAERAAA